MSEQNTEQFGGDYVNLTKDEIQPDPSKYIHPDDRIYVAVWNSVTGLVVRVRGSVLLKNGSVAEFNKRITPTDDRVITETFIEIPSGYLKSVTVFPEGTTKRGQTFVSISVTRDAEDSNNRNQLLIQNYLQSGNALGYPNAQIITSTEGRGYVRTIQGTDPAANNNPSETVPTGAKWKVLYFGARLVTDANVANRYIRPIYDDGTLNAFVGRTHDAHAASTTRDYDTNINAEHQAAIHAGQNRVLGFIPDYPIPAGFNIGFTAVNMQVGDNWAAPTLVVEEWIEA